MQDMASSLKIKLLQSAPYYAHAESSNKVIINIIKKMLEENPKQWHEKLLETLWAYRTSEREATVHLVLSGHFIFRLFLKQPVARLELGMASSEHHLPLGNSPLGAVHEERQIFFNGPLGHFCRHPRKRHDLIFKQNYVWKPQFWEVHLQ
ncbi:unnamed protein product [Prunus brigantina]